MTLCTFCIYFDFYRCFFRELIIRNSEIIIIETISSKSLNYFQLIPFTIRHYLEPIRHIVPCGKSF